MKRAVLRQVGGDDLLGLPAPVAARALGAYDAARKEPNMPMVEIEIVAAQLLSDALAGELASGLAPILGGPSSGTWVKLRRLEATHYAEGDGGPPAGVRPVFVTVLRADLPPTGDRRDEARRIATAVGGVCNRAVENVHVVYEPPARGRVAFGGNLLE